MTLAPIHRAPPAPGMRNAYACPYPYNYWHQIVRVEPNRWCLLNHFRTLGTVGDAATIADALRHMPIAGSLYEMERQTPRRNARTPAPDLGIDLNLDELLKGL